MSGLLELGSLIGRCSGAEKQGLGTSVQTVHRISGLLLRLLDITPASSLSFVLDTTGSMGEEINAAKIQARHIVEQRRGTPMEPTHYVLVPFHDPGNYGLARRVEASPGQEVMSLVGKWASWLHFRNRMEALPRILVLHWYLYAFRELPATSSTVSNMTALAAGV